MVVIVVVAIVLDGSSQYSDNYQDV